jgi:penicillin-binding protein 1A
VNPYRRKWFSNESPFRPKTEETAKGQKGTFFGGILRFIMLICLGTAAFGVGAATQGYLFFTGSLPSVDKLKNYAPPIVTEFYSDDMRLIADFAYQRRYVVDIDDVPQMLQNAFVAAEDKNFWRHGGVDKEAILRAVKKNLMSGGLKEGASTITQQVAKTFLLTPERKFSRKIKEAILSTRIEAGLSKKQILHLYLNQIYLGSSSYGVEAAARTYFGKHVNELSIAECAMLAGLAKAPTTYSPRRNLKKSLERRAYVLKRMQEDGFITEAQYEEANQETPVLAAKSDPYKRIAPDFAEHVRRYVDHKYGSDALYREGLQVFTTVNLDMTLAAQRAVDRGLREVDKRQGYRGPVKTLNVKGVMDFLQEKTESRTEPIRFGDVVEGVVTHIDDDHIYVRMGGFVQDGVKREYTGKIKIDKSRDWWVRKPYLRAEMRTRNFAEGELPYQVGDLIYVRVQDPNIARRELYLKKFGKTDPDLKNYKEYTEENIDSFMLEPEQEPLVEAALMMRENRSGYVRVMLGGRVFTEGNYNRATQAKRQPGSAFKPVIFAAALNKGFTAADVILDSPLALTVPGTNEVWRPKNFGGGFHGPVTFRDALVKSRNVPTIKILQQIGVEHAKAYARKMGYTSPLANNLTMALGSNGVSLEEQLAAYSVFPNKGYLVPNAYVTKIIDRHGRVIEENAPPAFNEDSVPADQPRVRTASLQGHPPRLNPAAAPERASHNFVTRAVDEATAFIMTDLLQGVIQEGTATGLKKIVGRPDIAGKTGTTNDCLDAWFMGFSPDYTCGVWVGFDDEQSLGDGEIGGKTAAPIWGYFMKEALKNVPIKEFPPTQAVEFRRVDPRTGLVTASASGIREVFKVGGGTAQADPGMTKGARWDYAGSDLDQF